MHSQLFARLAPVCLLDYSRGGHTNSVFCKELTGRDPLFPPVNRLFHLAQVITDLIAFIHTSSHAYPGSVPNCSLEMHLFAHLELPGFPRISAK